MRGHSAAVGARTGVIEIPGYVIRHEIGHGGMASVYLALQTSLDREVALKVMSPALAADPTFTRRFLQEARMLASLAHPNIVQVFDVGVTGAQQHYFSMQYLAGGDFAARVQRGLSESELKRVLLGVANALGYAHQRGYVHRDVAPGNILFDANDNPVLTDFGIALAASQGTRITSTGFSVGTSHYMSPEQARGGDIDARSDLYSLGVLTWFGLTGAPPYDGADGFAVAYAHVFEAIPRLPAEKAHWQGLVDKALAKDPKDRFADVAAFVDALESIATRNGATAAAPPVPAVSPAPPSPRPARTAAERPAPTPAAAPPPRPAVAAPAAPGRGSVRPAPSRGNEPAAAPAPAALTVAPPTVRGKGGLWAGLAIGALALAAGGYALWMPANRGSSSAPSRPAVTATPPVTAPLAATSAGAAPGASPSGGDAPATAAATDAMPTGAAPAAATGEEAAQTPAVDGSDQALAALELAASPTVVDPVQELVKLGRADLAAQRYTTPPGMNALERFRLALRIDGKDRSARQGVVDTARAYLGLADKAHAAGDNATMNQHFAKALEIAGSLPEGKPVLDEVAQRRAALATPFLEQAAKAAAAWDKATAKTAYDQALALDPDNAAAREGLKKLAAIGAPGYVFRDRLADGAAGPEMIVVSGVAVGRTEVSRGDFRRYWNAAGGRAFAGKEPSCRDRESFFRSSKKRNWQAPDLTQDDSHPVVCVSWDEAAAYARWLAEQTGHRYRLLSNAEWDQLVRGAGTPACTSANLADADFAKAYDSKGTGCSDGYPGTAPTGHFPAAGGVFDADGNVREWVNACGNGTAAGAGCRDHRYRGRAWLSLPDKEPAGFSDSAAGDVAANSIGFRIAREIDQ